MVRKYPYPRKWSEMSVELQLMGLIHIAMGAMMILGSQFAIWQELVVAGTLFAGAVAVSIRRRRDAGWRWRGASGKDWAMALLAVVVGVLFVESGLPLHPLDDPHVLPWDLGVGNLSLYGGLRALHVVRDSEAEFLADCDGDAAESGANQEPPMTRRRRVLRAVIGAASVAVFLIINAEFYLFGVGIRDGEPAPTATHTEELNNHGRRVFVTPREKELIDGLSAASNIGFLVLFVAAVVFRKDLEDPPFEDDRSA